MPVGQGYSKRPRGGKQVLEDFKRNDEATMAASLSKEPVDAEADADADANADNTAGEAILTSKEFSTDANFDTDQAASKGPRAHDDDAIAPKASDAKGIASKDIRRQR